MTGSARIPLFVPTPSARPPGAAGPATPAATVSVVIPCFNYADYLPSAVASALTQVGVSVQVIIVDDASTDDSAEVARRLAADDSRVRALRNRTNLGPVATFNRGLAHATGEFLVRLDADDLLTPGSLRRSVDVAQAFPGVGLVYGHPVHFSGEPPARHRSRVQSWTVWDGWRWLDERCRDGHNVITSPEVLMRTAVVDRVGGQRPLTHTHDMEMWLRISSVSDIAHIEGPDQAWHREHPRSLSQQGESFVGITILEEKRAAFDMLFEGLGDRPGARALHAEAHRALARLALRRACHEFDRNRSTQRALDTLLGFVARLDIDATELTEWRRLHGRIHLGQAAVSRRPWYTAIAAARRAVDVARYRTWTRWGVYTNGRPATGRVRLYAR